VHERREISPMQNMSADEFLRQMPSEYQGIVSAIRAAKDDGNRPVPSATLVDRSSMLTVGQRAALLDMVASLVDENLAGRSEMCIQFGLLIHRALEHLKVPNYAATGDAIYFSDSGDEIYRWRHVWVRAGTEIVDGNVDSIPENPVVPDTVKVAPYWGPVKGIPGRRLIERNYSLPDDTDVDSDWWPRLRIWLDNDFRGME
jgi:hypothetical protein